MDIFYNTIHSVNATDYTAQQLDAWAPSSCLELTSWYARWQVKPPYVALIDQTILGFTEFEQNGHIDCFYVHHEYQGQKVGSVLIYRIEKTASTLGLAKLFAEVSITAKPFFESKGFKEIRKQQIKRNGESLTNFVMEKHL